MKSIHHSYSDSTQSQIAPPHPWIKGTEYNFIDAPVTRPEEGQDTVVFLRFIVKKRT